MASVTDLMAFGLAPKLAEQLSDTDVAKEMVYLESKTNSNRGDPGTAGRIIFNSDDGQLNIDDGTNWTLPDGTTT